MDMDPAANWDEFLVELRTNILPLYEKHEWSFDGRSIHGRMHVCRCLLFAEFMCRYYYQHTRLTPRHEWVRYAVAFHDAGRERNGPDLWEADSARCCEQYLEIKGFGEAARAISQMIPKEYRGAYGVEMRIVHDADVLDIMRPCCGHGGRSGFRETALRFLGERDDPGVRDEHVRMSLIEEAWHLIQLSEQAKELLRSSTDYMAGVLAILGECRKDCPLLVSCLL